MGNKRKTTSWLDEMLRKLETSTVSEAVQKAIREDEWLKQKAQQLFTEEVK